MFGTGFGFSGDTTGSTGGFSFGASSLFGASSTPSSSAPFGSAPVTSFPSTTLGGQAPTSSFSFGANASSTAPAPSTTSLGGVNVNGPTPFGGAPTNAAPLFAAGGFGTFSSRVSETPRSGQGFSLAHSEAQYEDQQNGVPSKRRLGFCFGPSGNDIIVWRTRPRDEREIIRERARKEPPPPPSDALWAADIEAPLSETHKLYSEAHTVFAELQSLASEFHNRADLLREAQKKSSKNYRAIINILINNLERKLLTLKTNRQMDDEQLDGQTKELSAQLTLWKLGEIIWHLCDIFFISSKPDSVITEAMVTWLQHFDIQIENENKNNTELQDIIHEIVSASAPEEHERFWPVLYKLVLRGQILKALELLYAHSERRAQTQTKRRIAKSTKNNIWLKLEVLLKQTPILRVGDSRVEFEVRWEQWRADCRSLQAQAESRGDDDLLILLSLLSGDESVLRDLSSNWQEFLVGKLLFSEPTTKNVEYRLLMDQVTRYFAPSNELFEQILLNIINFEPYEVIHKSWELLRWWFAAHLTDLLYHAGHVEDIQLDEGGDLREHLLLGFVREELSSSGKTESTWHLAVNYLSFCSTFGKAYMRHLLERVPMESEKQAYKAITVCAQHGLTEQAKLLFKIMGMQKYRERRYGASIQWFVRAGHPGRLAQVANKLVDDFYQGSVVNAEEVTAVVEQLDKDFIFSDRLIFLSKVRDLKRYQEQRNWRAVAALTVEVIAKNLAPRRYWIRLLREVVPLLEATPVLFDFQQTELLMASLEDLTSAHYSTGFTSDVAEDELSAIRLALARNRARAICFSAPSSLHSPVA